MRTILFLLVLSWGNWCAAQPFILPKLPYAYQDYAPHIDAQTMEIHLTKHHQAYVNNLNKEIKGTPMESQSLVQILMSPSLSDPVRNNAGGHYNHSLFWEILAPKEKQGEISEELLAAIKNSFGSIDSVQKAINKAAMSRFGSGWAWLLVTPEGKLQVVSSPNQDNPLMVYSSTRGIPILGIDVWEHAYYLNYQNRRADYLSALWVLMDWAKVSDKYQEALKNINQLFPQDAKNKHRKKRN